MTHSRAWTVVVIIVLVAWSEVACTSSPSSGSISDASSSEGCMDPRDAGDAFDSVDFRNCATDGLPMGTCTETIPCVDCYGVIRTACPEGAFPRVESYDEYYCQCSGGTWSCVPWELADAECYVVGG